MSDVFNKLFRRITIWATSNGPKNALKAKVEGIEGETDETLLQGTIGVIANPRPKDAFGAATGIAAVGADELNPIATYDRRIAEARGEVPKGAVTLAGYEGQHVTVEGGATAGQPKITIAIEGATITMEGGVLGPTIRIAYGNELTGARVLFTPGPFGPTLKLERDGPPPSSITLGPTGNVDLVGLALTFNTIPMQVP